MFLLGNCLDTLKDLPDNSVHSIVTDPPYGFSFMGKKWDYDVPSVEIWEECLRVLKAGGHLLAFSGTRTQHRMAVRIEDAGFEIRDMIAWIYGSGFPKSHNIGKAVDKIQVNKREVVGYQNNPSFRDQGKKSKEIIGIDKLSFGQVQNAERQQTEITKGNSEFEGWGTALKPALEPITMARKPLSEKTIAENCLKHKTGGINIDGCRVKLSKGDDPRLGGKGTWKTDKASSNVGNAPTKGKRIASSDKGRFPANLIHDGSDKVEEMFPEQNSRFFYCAKTSRKERNEGLEKNHHPTVKPIALMSYLVRLVTPKDGIVLDPFMGSGSTGIACVKEGFDFIGCELDEEYMEIAKARIGYAENKKKEEPQGLF